MCPFYSVDIKSAPRHRAFGYSSNIPGWMHSAELAWLHLVAQEMDNIVEIGSWMGRSTDALLSGCKGTVWAVDHFKGSKEHLGCKDSVFSEIMRRNIHEDFLKNVGHYKNLELLKMNSLEAVKRFEDKSVDMVFIDSGHEYEEVMADIKAWLPKTKKLICGHDYCDNYKGIKRAVDEFLGDVYTFGIIWRKPIKEVL